MILETERMYLREMNQGDFDALCAILKDPEAMYAYEGAFSDEEVQAWLDRQLLRYRTWGFGLWAAVLKETGEMIGQCGLTMQPWRDGQVLEIGYLFRRAFWHRGYAVEAAAACRRYAFETLGAEEVCSIVRDTNTASQNVALRNGMRRRDQWTKRYRGVDMPHYRYVACRGEAAGIRRGTREDIPAVAAIYDRILTEEEQGRASVGWIRGVYPTEATALEALEAGELFVMTEGGNLTAAARINRVQVPEYSLAPWAHPEAPADRIMVLHTLVVDPLCGGKGHGSAFVGFYERYALEQGCPYLRMDTNEKNAAARRLYRRLGYSEAGIVPCAFNGIPGVRLVCLEKKLEG